MKRNILFPAILFILAGANCNNAGTTTVNNEATTTLAAEDNGIVGEWDRMGGGKDKNDNGKLDDEEIDKNDPLPGGFDYLHFYANGNCVFTNDKIEATYTIKQEPKTKGKTIFIYSSSLPKSLSDKEKDENAFRMRIFSIEATRLYLKPAHSTGEIVAYKKK